MTTTANGWAVMKDGEIDVNTVGPHRRHAIVNYLHTHDVPMYDNYDDGKIDALWDIHAPPGATCVPIRVTALADEP